MIDTIGIIVKIPLDEFVKKIIDPSKLSKDQRKDHVYWIENLRVTGNQSCTFIKGSLTRFLLGSNLKNLSIIGIHKALDKLVSLINISTSELMLYRIDIGINFIMKNNVQNYFRQFDSLKFFRKDISANTTYFRNKSTELCFYDKRQELIAKDKMDDKITNKNIARYELRLKKRINQTLNISEDKLSISSLYEKETLLHLLNMYLYYFERIKKVPVDNINISPSNIEMLHPTILKKYLASVGLEKIGIDNLFYHINFNQYTSQQKYHLKKSLDNLNNILKVEITNNDYEELERKVKNAVEKRIIKINKFYN